MERDTGYSRCDRCGVRIKTADNCGDPPLTLCRSCRERYYDHCVACGCFAERELLHYPSGGNSGYCDECYARYFHNS